MAAGFDSVTAAAARSVLGATQYDKDKFALGADGQRFTAGGQDPKVTSALGAYQLALDKVQNYGKCYLTTGLDAGTTNRRKDELQAAMNAAFAGYQDALASSQSSAASALKPYEKASVTPGRGAVAGGYEIRFVMGNKTCDVVSPSQTQAEALVRELEEAFSGPADDRAARLAAFGGPVPLLATACQWRAAGGQGGPTLVGGGSFWTPPKTS